MWYDAPRRFRRRGASQHHNRRMYSGWEKSKPLRPQQRSEKIDEQQHGRDASKPNHGKPFLDPIAGDDEGEHQAERRQPEEEHREKQHHRSALLLLFLILYCGTTLRTPHDTVDRAHTRSKRRARLTITGKVMWFLPLVKLSNSSRKCDAPQVARWPCKLQCDKTSSVLITLRVMTSARR